MMRISDMYQAALAAGKLRPDPVQAKVVAALEDLARRVESVPAGRLAFWRSSPAADYTRGIYLHGPVGRGKSMLMDMFFVALAESKKRRIHFHAFMIEVHQALHAWRQQSGHGADPLPKIAQEIADRYRILCFDEFQVTDIADAMILSRLFGALFAAGVTLVATSNTAPESLYAGGLQRANFLPFITLLKQHVEVLNVAGERDYRLDFLRGHQVYFTPLGAASSAGLADLFAGLAANAALETMIVPVQNRAVAFSRTAHGVLWSDFAELCGRPLGAADYQAVSTTFRAVLLDGVPQFQAEQSNEAIRFITLVDSLYEAKVKLALAAQAQPEALYPAAGQYAAMFQRTASRLYEMQGTAYLAAAQDA